MKEKINEKICIFLGKKFINLDDEKLLQLYIALKDELLRRGVINVRSSRDVFNSIY